MGASWEESKSLREEHGLLKNHLRSSPLIAIRSRYQALLMWGKGMKLADIGDIVSRDAHTMTRWSKEWKAVRMASIFTGHQGNENASKLTKEQRQEIRDTLGQKKKRS